MHVVIMEGDNADTVNAVEDIDKDGKAMETIGMGA
jgi:hypothetical protein